ncbi:3'(2'),5'-bisphosphate nucleotidase CysQ [Oculatella sp. FACHB-28]|nr:3'(2'),5'-bisphosphate nucleotidase CysQ [Cyanobacteria bacterium FACHB-471]MBD1997127.1 3'(2'),5'-bisphosphate nucleotidase CysQ [Leptolyngbya sp. FACHB-541]MBD2055843.1 3'(2'),5'-bisphosphate nucleotidase CysQ [Oculatella sp. FACHB-28]MBD2069151.1 3'(2'),5'-bisphosphate nucleotidase CysQ [Leptolyngbya sp. FACHB-671]
MAGTPVEDILAIARSLGWGASRILRSYYRGEPWQDGTERDLEVQEKKDGPVTAADLAVNSYILDNLQAALGTESFGYLSEETYKAKAAAIANEWVWIIDPLDGTRDFIDKTGEYAFHLALTHQGRPVLTVVTCPELEKLYYATLGGGAFVETPDGATSPLRVSEQSRIEDLKLVVSRSHRDERFNNLLQQLPCQNQVYVGSVGGKIAAIVEQRADVYLSLSGKSAPKDWDMAAPELILTEAGGQFTHADGTPLQYNTGDVNQWGCLIASNGTFHTELRAIATQILNEVDN